MFVEGRRPEKNPEKDPEKNPEKEKGPGAFAALPVPKTKMSTATQYETMPRRARNITTTHAETSTKH